MRKRSLSLSQGNYLIGAVELHHRKTKVTGGGLLKACALYLIGLHIYCWLEFDYCQCAFFWCVQRMYPTSEEVLISRMWSTEMQVKIREEKQLVENDPGK